ncbi:MAG: hypothetical protein ACXWR4_08450 [Bdellovibrionota bacterium]
MKPYRLLVLLPLVFLRCSTVQEARKPAGTGDFLQNRATPASPQDRHVLMMHLDGFNSDAFQTMLAAGQLPHFAFLSDHGRLSTRASTVDKSETMKVIPSYLSSKVDTHITAWWQFDRSHMAFSNFWVDPMEVVNYALGLDFPLYPTVVDVMARDKQEVIAGFNLFRRGVKFQNYSRVYLEGLDAVSSFRYYRQADASTTELVKLILQRSGEQKPPRLITGLLAAADEMTHLNGLTTHQEGAEPIENCISPDSSPTKDLFPIVERALHEREGTAFFGKTYRSGQIVSGKGLGHFTQIQRNLSGHISRLCFLVPSVSVQVSITQKKNLYLYPDVALAYILVDMEVGRILNGLRNVTLGETTKVVSNAHGIEDYVARKQLEGTLFENTLFLFYGDHGMVNSFKEMNPPLGIPAEKINRDAASFDIPFVQVLAQQFGLAAYVAGKKVGAGEKYVVDYRNLPSRLDNPAADLSWQTPDVKSKTDAARAWAGDFFTETSQSVKDAAHAKYWWLLFLRKPLVDPKVDKTLSGVRDSAIPVVSKIFLEGDGGYKKAEREANVRFYNEHVPMVYGGGALNNAELFFPAQGGWGPRPSYESLRGNAGLMEKLKTLPGVGLIFIRKQNSQFIDDGVLPPRLEIVVLDQKGGEGLITVTVDPQSKERIYHYKVESGKSDPLMYGDLGRGTYGTYAQWNRWSVERGHFYHNAVAGMGSYLYSSSPAIGDISMMHEAGWNFGENLGGHGGLESGEKLTVMLASGPGVGRGELMARAPFVAGADGKLSYSPYETSPTNLDVAPTALSWLGYASIRGEGELTRFSRNGFAAYLKNWTDFQKKSCAQDGGALIGQLASGKGIDLQPAGKTALQGRLSRLCYFLGRESPVLPDYNASKEDGNLLELE